MTMPATAANSALRSAVVLPLLPNRLSFIAGGIANLQFRNFVTVRNTGTHPRKMSSSCSNAPVSAPSDYNGENKTIIDVDGGRKDGDGQDVIVQYVVLRKDLVDTWPIGSVVTQGCHASVAAIWCHKDDPYTVQYCCPQSIDSMRKVTLEVKGEIQILNLSERLKAGRIDHKVWIEQPENITTCLATKPYPKSVVSSFFKKLKLCK